MEYTIKEVSKIAGVSARTLRYYDEINLLKPSRVSSSGYRIYGENEVDLLQQIMFYKALGFKLDKIKEIIVNPNFDINVALEEQHKELILRKKQLDELISLVEKTISYRKGEVKMSNKEKFEAFKREAIDKNEEMYGEEVRRKYGKEASKEFNKKFLSLSEEEFKNKDEIEEEMIVELRKVVQDRDLDSSSAKKVFENHRKWLNYYWTKYSKEAHAMLAESYVQDERFADYYNKKAGVDCVEVLRDIIIHYTR